MTSSEKRMLLPILRKLANREKLNHRAQSAAEQLYARLTRPSLKSKAAKVRQRIEKQSARASHNQETRAIRAAVEKRSDGFCESVGFHGDGSWLHGGPREWDHWLHGIGRRRQFQSVETTWMLCRTCHRARQENRPSAAYWNGVRERFCGRYGYPFEAHIEHAAWPAKAGGAP